VTLDRLVATAVSPQFDRDDSVYFLTESELHRARVNQGVWERCTEPFFGNRDDYTRYLTSLAVATSGQDAHTLFIGSADGEFNRLVPDEAAQWTRVWPMPTVTREPPTPVPCPSVPDVYPVDERFQIDYADLPQKLGCAVEPATSTAMAFQPFELARMLWREDKREIYVLHHDTTWETYEDTWDETEPEGDPNLAPPVQLIQPKRGFGKVWREQLDGAESRVGWATEEESGLEGVVQVFNYGLLVKGRESEPLYVLYYDRTWEMAAAHESE
jgi:hypothetical protein